MRPPAPSRTPETAMAGRGRYGRVIAPLALLALVAGCAELPRLPVTAAAPPEIAAPEDIRERSQESVALGVHYQRLENDLLAQGLLRTDGGGIDTPFNARDLTTNFLRIALRDEYVTEGDGLVARETESRLRRWKKPVRMQLIFGATVAEEQRARDTEDVTAFAARLAEVTGLRISQTDTRANFHVLVLNEDDRRAFGPELDALMPGMTRATKRAFLDLPKDQLCAVIGALNADGVTYDRAIALIRGEHPPLMRLSCIHEELAQGLGLANDSPQARPSIFNDDEEFAYLTRHDELLLEMLYDPRLEPGMTVDDAAPLVRRIAEEIIAETTGGPV